MKEKGKIVDDFLKNNKNILVSTNNKLPDDDYLKLIEYCEKYKTKNLIKYYFNEAKKRNDLMRFVSHYQKLKFSLKYKNEIYKLNNTELFINMLYYDTDYKYNLKKFFKNNIDNIFNVLKKITDIDLINKLLFVIEKSNDKYKYDFYFELYLSILYNKITIENNSIKCNEFIYYVNNIYSIIKKEHSKLFQLSFFEKCLTTNNTEIIKNNNYLYKNNILIQLPNNKVAFIFNSNKYVNLEYVLYSLGYINSEYETYIITKYNYHSVLSNIEKYLS